VAVVAILTALAVPALTHARRQAQSVVCRSNLRQLGSAFAVYAGDSGGCMPSTSRRWQPALRLLSCDGRNELLFCPRAKRFPSQGGRHPFAAYNAFSFDDGLFDGPFDTFEMPDVYTGYGSSGLNGWVCNPAPDVRINAHGFSTACHWRRADVKGAGAVPLLLDSQWVDGYPHHTDSPPTLGVGPADPGTPPGPVGRMDVFCLDRHGGRVNGVFLDLSCRSIGLKALWTLKWHRAFDTTAPSPDWPDWMSGF